MHLLKWGGAVYQSADYHAVVYPDLHRRAGRASVCPLAFTKTYAMAGAALLAIVVIPILMGYWIRGKIPPESSNPLNRF